MPVLCDSFKKEKRPGLLGRGGHVLVFFLVLLISYLLLREFINGTYLLLFVATINICMIATLNPELKTIIDFKNNYRWKISQAQPYYY